MKFNVLLKKFYPLGDGMEYSNNMEFSTYDADHDNTQYRNCAADLGGGFWFKGCGYQNINGYYSGSNYKRWQLVWWDDHNNLKETQLMIRPAA